MSAAHALAQGAEKVVGSHQQTQERVRRNSANFSAFAASSSPSSSVICASSLALGAILSIWRSSPLGGFPDLPQETTPPHFPALPVRDQSTSRSYGLPAVTVTTPCRQCGQVGMRQKPYQHLTTSQTGRKGLMIGSCRRCPRSASTSARELCQKVLSYASPQEHHAEEIDPRTGRHLVNLSQDIHPSRSHQRSHARGCDGAGGANSVACGCQPAGLLTPASKDAIWTSAKSRVNWKKFQRASA